MKLNQEAWAIQYELDVHNEYSPEILAATLYGRIISTYQTTLMIAEKGMMAQSYTLIRCLLEPLFPLVAISKDPQYIDLLIDSDEIKTKKNIEKYIKYLEKNKIQGNIEKLKKLMADLKEKIKRENLKEIKVYDCAVKAELEDIYNIYYSFTSMHLHVGMKSLEEGMVLDFDNTSIEELKNEPELDGFETIYMILIECLLRAFKAICEIFEIEKALFIDSINQELEKII